MFVVPSTAQAYISGIVIEYGRGEHSISTGLLMGKPTTKHTVTPCTTQYTTH